MGANPACCTVSKDSAQDTGGCEASAESLPAYAGSGSFGHGRGSFAVSFGDFGSDHGDIRGANDKAKFDAEYKVEWSKKPLGTGTYSTVHLATKNGQPFAIKYMKRALLRESAQYEVKLMKACSQPEPHPNIVFFLDCFQDNREIILVVEYCSGGELFDIIVEDGPFDEDAVGCCQEQMLQAVCYLHSQRIMHRDLKAENWLLAEPAKLKRATLKLCDFGLAKRFEKDELTETWVGTPYYIAPEIARRQPYNEKVDVWTLGIVLHMLLLTAPPYRGNTTEVLEHVGRKGDVFPPSRMESLHSSFSGSLVKLICAMLDKDPSRRLSATAALDHTFFKEHKDAAKSVRIKNHARPSKGSPRTGSPRGGSPRENRGSRFSAESQENGPFSSRSPRETSRKRTSADGTGSRVSNFLRN